MKANVLLKHNIDTLLRARGHSRRDLAQWCRRTESWLSQIFTNAEREIPLKYLDRIADFFGLATYQLFQPGISPLTERRKGLDRRSGHDRRKSALNHRVRESVSHLVATLSPADVADLIRWRALDEPARETVREALLAVERSVRAGGARKTRRPRAETDVGGATAATTRGDRGRAGGE